MEGPQAARRSLRCLRWRAHGGILRRSWWTTTRVFGANARRRCLRARAEAPFHPARQADPERLRGELQRGPQARVPLTKHSSSASRRRRGCRRTASASPCVSGARAAAAARAAGVRTVEGRARGTEGRGRRPPGHARSRLCLPFPRRCRRVRRRQTSGPCSWPVQPDRALRRVVCPASADPGPCRRECPPRGPGAYDRAGRPDAGPRGRGRGDRPSGSASSQPRARPSARLASRLARTPSEGDGP